MSTLRRKLELLYDSYSEGLYRYLMTFTKSESDAKDLLQELFVKLAIQNGETEIRNEKAFIYQVGHRLALDWLRRRSTRRKAEDTLSIERAEDTQFMPDPDQAIIRKQFSAAMDALPPEQRSIAHLKLFDEMTFEEIAHSQGIPLNTAASRYRYALEKLRTLLRPIYEELI
jgi:RNA polymerase sigma-70 factor (ECF subfamily)